MSKVKYTKKELAEFRRLVRKAESQRQMDRIEARLEQPKFIEKHGREKCDAMFEELMREWRT
jgi:hypothetical protein